MTQKSSTHKKVKRLLLLEKKYLKRYKKLQRKIKLRQSTKLWAASSCGDLQPLYNALEKVRTLIYRLRHFLQAAAMSGGLVLASSSGSHAQGLGEWSSAFPNPFKPPVSQSFFNPLDVADIDGDGDLDVFYSSFGDVEFTENIGTPEQPEFVDRISPLNGFNFSTGGFEFVDIDNDGDLDLFKSLDNFAGSFVRFFENIGTVSNPEFVERTGAENPLDGFSSPLQNPDISFVDIDDDGDLDVFIITEPNTSGETIRFYRNTNSPESPVFSPVSGPANPFNGLNTEIIGGRTFNFLNFTFIDYDNDGLEEAIGGDRNGGFLLFERDSQSEVYNEVTGAGNAFDQLVTGNLAWPDLADIDNDGDLDIISGTNPDDYYYASGIDLFVNDGSNTFNLQSDDESPFEGVDVGFYAVPTFVDIDGDNDMDAFVGTKNSDVRFFERVDAEFIPRVVNDNPAFGAYGGGRFKRPTFVDIDQDGDYDMFVGETYEINFFRNEGTSTNPNLIEDSGGNPFSGTAGLGYYQSITFGDVDLDGDIDAIVGVDSDLQLYENDGFGEFTPVASTLDAIPNLSYDIQPHLVDIDHDGDLDLVIAATGEGLYLYENQGGGNFTSLVNQLPEVIQNSGLAGTTVDYDGDGDLDIFTGNYYGHLFYYENTNVPADLNTTTVAFLYDIEEDESISLNPQLSIQDDNTQLIEATIEITENFVFGEDSFGINVPSGLELIQIAETGTIIISGSATLAEYAAAINSLTYENNANDPSTLPRTIEISVVDSDNTRTNLDIATLTLEISNPVNQPPVVENSNEEIVFGGVVEINLFDLVSDPENDELFFNILESPRSGAIAEIVNGTLRVDYADLFFIGQDVIRVEVCDGVNPCVELVININVEREGILPYNVVSPNGDNRHDVFEIANIEQFPDNQVIIVNRWGDKVYETTNYDNATNAFSGLNSAGNNSILPDGTYYYIIKLLDTGEEVSGYLVLKR